MIRVLLLSDTMYYSLNQNVFFDDRSASRSTGVALDAFIDLLLVGHDDTIVGNGIGRIAIETHDRRGALARFPNTGFGICLSKFVDNMWRSAHTTRDMQRSPASSVDATGRVGRIVQNQANDIVVGAVGEGVVERDSSERVRF